MSVATLVAAETGLDLSDPKLVENTLAPRFAERVSVAFPFVDKLTQAASAAMAAFRAYKSLSGSMTVLGTYQLAAAAAQAAAVYLEGRLDESISDNYRRMEAARNLAIQTHVKPGDWSVVVPVQGRKVGTVDLYDNAGGWSEAQFLAQYAPGVLFMSHRPAKSDILMPAWAAPPFTSGYGFAGVTGPNGAKFPGRSALAGHTSSGFFLDAQPPVAPFPAKYDATYFGTLPAASPAEMAELLGEPTKRFKLLMRLIEKVEQTYFTKPFVPPPDYNLLFSVGTYPFTSWSAGAHGGADPLNATMAAYAAAVHSLTPIHAMVRASRVAQCYRAWTLTTRIRNMPTAPKKQSDGGVFLDAMGLPYSVNAVDPVQLVAPLPADAPPDKWGDPLYKLGLARTYTLPWQTVRAIEMSYRSFFSVRRAAIYQMAANTETFKAAARKAPDLELRLAAEGKPPAYKPWDARDPLGEGWLQPSGGGGGFMKIPGAPPPGKAGGKAAPSGKASGGSSDALILAGAAALFLAR